jgi:hypothetical protein
MVLEYAQHVANGEPKIQGGDQNIDRGEHYVDADDDGRHGIAFRSPGGRASRLRSPGKREKFWGLIFCKASKSSRRAGRNVISAVTMATAPQWAQTVNRARVTIS